MEQVLDLRLAGGVDVQWTVEGLNGAETKITRSQLQRAQDENVLAGL
jgi:hypothetical protein